MARGFSIVFAIVIFTILATSAFGSPVPKHHEHAVEKLKEELGLSVKAVPMKKEAREGRQYGYPSYGGSFANAQASASANTFGGGYGGNFANANAQASANSFGSGYGK